MNVLVIYKVKRALSLKWRVKYRSPSFSRCTISFTLYLLLLPPYLLSMTVFAPIIRTASYQVLLELLFYFLLLFLALALFVTGVWIVVADLPKQKTQKDLQMRVLTYESNTLRFHPGRQPVLTKEQQRQKDKERERKKQIKRTFYKEAFHTWRILPCSLETKFFIDTLSGTTFLQKMKSLESYGSFQVSPKPCSLFPNYKPSPTILAEIQERKKVGQEILVKNQHLRWIFKRFLTKWRIQRFRLVNDTDFITLSPIDNPIHLYNFGNRCQYIFDGKSLLQHIHKRLLHHDGQIPEPLVPMNPFTNEAFTLSQMIVIHSAMKQQGHSSWTLEAFVKCKFQTQQLLNHFRKPLRLHALKSILYDYSDWDGIDLLLNFIESHHDEHNSLFHKNLYAFFLREMPDEVKIQEWRSLCRDFYQEDILAEDTDQRDIAFYRARRKTEHLCGPPHDLVAKRTFFLRSKKDASNRSGTV